MTNTLDDVQNVGGLVYSNVISGLVFSAIVAVMLSVMDWRCSLVVVAAIVCVLAINALMQHSSHAISSHRVAAQRAIVGAILEYVQGIAVVRAFNLVDSAEGRLSRAIDECERMNLSMELHFIGYMIVETLVTKFASIALCLLAVFSWVSQTMETGTCLLMIVAAFMVYTKLELAGSYASLLRQIDICMDKVNDLIATPKMGEGAGIEGTGSFDIELDDVSFSYGERDVIRHVSLSIPQGSSCAIVGPSGGGKTTLAHLMARFWDGAEIGRASCRERV